MKNAFNKFVLALLIMTLASSSVIAFASAKTDSNENTANDRVVPHVLSLDEQTSININEVSYNIIVVHFDDIDRIADYALDMVYAGMMIYIVAPEVGQVELSYLLGIPHNSIPRYNNAVLLGIYISMMHGLYVWGNHYAQINNEFNLGAAKSNENGVGRHEMITPSDDMPFSNVILLNDIYNSILRGTGLTSYALHQPEAIISIFENHVDTLAFSSQLKRQDCTIVPFGYIGGLPTTGSLIQVFTNTVSVFLHGHYHSFLSPFVGTLHGTKYIYSHGQFNVNGRIQSIFDGLTIFSARPYRGQMKHVSSFTGRIHCNISGHTYLGSTRLPSGNTGGAVGVSISGSGPAISFSYSFNPNGINISDSSPTLNVVDWRMSTPLIYFPQPGRIRDIAPAMRMATTNHAGGRGIFSYFFLPVNGLSGPIGLGVGNSQPMQFQIGNWF